jgi:hyperosmotically inducible periplasmic protein
MTQSSAALTKPKEKFMKTLKPFVAALALLCLGSFVGCSSTPKSPDVADAIRKSLDQSGYKDVSVRQDREKGVVTLTGHVPADTDKASAESIAKGFAGGQVVADEIQVLPPGNESATNEVSKDLDDGIEKNLAAVFIQDHFDRDVKYEVKNGVVTLKGTVSSQSRRAAAEKIATGVPNVVQVVNELEVKGQKATSTAVR